MKRQMTIATIIGIGIFTLVGCGPARVSITSTPTGALVYVNNKLIGRTPKEHLFDFKSRRKFNLQIRRPGYFSQSRDLDKRHSIIREKLADFQLEKDIREVVFITKPPRVTIIVEGALVGNTPTSHKFNFHKQDIYKVELKKEGLITRELNVDRGYVENEHRITIGAEGVGAVVPTRVESKIMMEEDPRTKGRR